MYIKHSLYYFSGIQFEEVPPVASGGGAPTPAEASTTAGDTSVNQPTTMEVDVATSSTSAQQDSTGAGQL